ncbi:hypothetical protein [Pseudomonas panipatensis]|uniref:Cobaltochelatase subunit CobS N-terminal domain-containing protein n=1 Tax=Pseudomonas panipatensis TaxID=428992 RepID=A0A1G8LHS2_9PSED|nr:hypothetical protein [Pseudomonas panipatensis]SDI55244.1 hypothetical protein SAMN05216272_111162 [Pseudomonas panipatensis]SMP74872.1 hypothetical protein SAMN06295951_11338 [Pseudomonas panipatensis]
MSDMGDAAPGSELPDASLDAAATFGVAMPWRVPGYSSGGPQVPARDPHYRFDAEACRAILLGFAHNRRVYLHGVQGVECSNHSVPTNKFNDLATFGWLFRFWPSDFSSDMASFRLSLPPFQDRQRRCATVGG